MENGSVQPPPDLAVPRVHCIIMYNSPPDIAVPRVHCIIIYNPLQIYYVQFSSRYSCN